MTDEQNESQQPAEVIQEGNQDAQLDTPVEQQAEEATSQGQPEQPATGQNDEYNERVQNWRALREKADRAEQISKENEDLQRRIQKYESSGPQDRPQKEEVVLGDEDLVENRHLKELEKKIAQQFQKQDQQHADSSIRNEFPDYETVVNNDTLGTLRDADPDLAQSILSNPNYYSKIKSAYKAIKMYGFVKNDAYKKQHEKVQANASKPRPLSSVAPQQGESPLSRANAFGEGLTPELLKELWREMQACRKK